MERQREAVDEAEAEAFDDPLPSIEESIITSGRIANIVIAVVCFAAIICCIVCLAVMAHKHSEVIHNLDPKGSNTHDKEVCILYATTEDLEINETFTKTLPKWNRSHACQFVIFGSSFVAGLLLLAIVYYIVRIFIMRSINALIFPEIAGFALLLLVMFSVAVVVSAGRAYTCDRLTKNIAKFEECNDVRVFYNNDCASDVKPVYIYSALKSSEVSAWISFLFLLALMIVSVVKMVIWFMRRSAQRRDERQLDNLIAPESDEDDEPLPM